MSTPPLLSTLALSVLLCAVAPGADSGYYPEDDFFDPVGVQPNETDEQDQDQRPMLGGQFTPPPRRVQEREDLGPDEGVYVFRVYDDSAADALGVKPGDVILDINDSGIGSLTDLRDAVFDQQVGDEARVTVSRNGERLELGGATFEAWPESIPLQHIDAEAERRYRQRQMSQVERNLQSLDQLDAERRQLADAIAEGEREREALADARQMARDVAERTETDEALLPVPLLALPAWRFDYGFAVNNHAVDEPTVATPVASTALTAVAPALDIELAIRASSEAL